MSAKKVQLNAFISYQTVKRFREWVALKHGYNHGALSFELETALNQYMAAYNKQQHAANSELAAEKNNPEFKTFSLKQEIHKWLVDSKLYMEVPQFIADKQLIAAINALRGTDIRTVKKWIKQLKKFGCIKESGLHQYEFV